MWALLSATFAGNLFLIARIWDGINDPLMGYLAQHTRSRWGRYRPWLLWMAVPTALTFVLLFYVPDWSEGGKEAYAIGTYVLFTMAFTALNIPYGTLTAVISPDYGERSRLTGFRMTFAMLGAILAGYAFLPMVGRFDDPGQGYLWAAIFFGMVLVGTLGIGFFAVKEQLQVAQEAFASFWSGWQSLSKNRPFWMLCITFGSCFVAYAVFASSIPYFGRYFLQDASLTSWLLLAVMGTTAVSIPIWTRLSSRLGKRGVFLVGALFYAIAMMGFFFLTPEQKIGAILLMILHGIGNGAAVLSSWAMVADTIEYGEWKTGVRVESMLYGVYGFFIKLGIGIGIWLVSRGLTLSGYVPNEAQSSEALQGIQLLLSLVPLFWIVVAFIAMGLYRIDTRLHRQIREELSHIG